MQDEAPYFVAEEYLIDMRACNTAYPLDLQIDPMITADLGEITEHELIDNCGEPAEALYTAPDDPGTETITLTVTWPDASSCESILQIEIEEENGE